MPTSRTEGNNIDVPQFLNEPRLSSSEKVRLINHEEVLKKRSRLQQPPPFSSATRENKEVLLREIQSKFRPQANAVLEFILDHQNDVTWDPNTNMVKVKGNVLEDSNIRDILLTLMNASIITRHTDIPPGTHKLYDVLVKDLDMPKSWMPATFAIRTSKRKKREKKQYGMGLSSWITY